jgi:predicted NAD-dependent protein-ADP-ribosyltransferase YbiA (DUF1768 family)
MTDISFTKVRGPHGWLSNMSPHPVWWQGVQWPTAEHLFQALRHPLGSSATILIHAERSPMAAKLTAKRYLDAAIVRPRSPEDLENMRLVLRCKRDQHRDLAAALRATGDARLIEDVTNRPNESGLFWGMARMFAPTGRGYESGEKCSTPHWSGENWLGRLWMDLRTSP